MALKRALVFVGFLAAAVADDNNHMVSLTYALIREPFLMCMPFFSLFSMPPMKRLRYGSTRSGLTITPRFVAMVYVRCRFTPNTY